MRINQRWFVWIILLLCVAAIPAGLIEQKNSAEKQDADSQSSDFIVSKLMKKDHIQVIKLTGMIIDKPEASIFSGKSGSSNACLKALRKAAKDKKVKAVLDELNKVEPQEETSVALSNKKVEVNFKAKF